MNSSIDLGSPVLGGLSPQAFMRKHWQKKPLLVRQAFPGIQSPIDRRGLEGLLARDDVESRLIQFAQGHWSLTHGPIKKSRLPAYKTPRWTALVQGLDTHLDEARALLDAFAFIPHARLDDLMISFATDGGGVGPHFDSYDVFLIQVQGQRRWRYGRSDDLSLRDDVPLKILQHFEPEHDEVLSPGDMLYLPPDWAHDGVAVGECMTCSVGFRSPSQDLLAQELLARLSTWVQDESEGRIAELYRDPGQPATHQPGAVPPALYKFAQTQVQRWARDPVALAAVLGEMLTEPKPQVWFQTTGEGPDVAGCGVRLHRATRMMFDHHGIYINGESFRGEGQDVDLMRTLANQRKLDAHQVARLGEGARSLLQTWVDDGWVEVVEPGR